MQQQKYSATVSLSTMWLLGSILLSLLATKDVFAMSADAKDKAHFLTKLMALSDINFCVGIPEENVSFGVVDDKTLRLWNSNHRFSVNPEHLSVLASDDNGIIRQRFVPSGRGSERVIWALDVKGQKKYNLTQSIKFEDGFDWGGDIESGKFAFGLGGGSSPTGGTLDKDGFTVRLAWRGHGDGSAHITLYVYSADRSQNIPYGDEFEVPGFTIPIGEWINISLRVTVNSDINEADGQVSLLVNDQQLFERSNILWQSEGASPEIDRLLFSSFHGGNSPDWKPDSTGYAQFRRVCLSN